MPLKAWCLLLGAAILTTPRAAQAVEMGTEDRATSHAVALALGTPGTAAVRCSGTLVSANVVLTARHCVSAVTTPAEPCAATLAPIGEGDLWVDVAPWTAEGAVWKKAAHVRGPTPSQMCGDDLALVVLDDPVAEHEAVPARPVVDVAEFRAVTRSRLLGLAAFGASTGSGTDAGLRRSRFDIPIRCVPTEPGFPCGRELDFIGEREFTSGSGPCLGDSGGGALATSDRNVVYGVLSRGEFADREACGLGVFERTDAWSWFIARGVLDAATDVPAPSWATALFPKEPKSGEYCFGNDACGDAARCVSHDGERSWTCASRCSSDGDCAAGRSCQSALCLPRAPSEPPIGGSCTLAVRGAGGGAWPLALLLAACLVRRHRLPRA